MIQAAILIILTSTVCSVFKAIVKKIIYLNFFNN